MNKILTIVIPTYNMEKYLDKCLTSLIVDDEQMKLLEVLVINDGSKDRSSEIAHNYEKKHPGTFRVIDKENGNYGSCVNRGVKEASGKYIKILDADDYFDTEAFEKLISCLIGKDTDMILTEMSYIEDGFKKSMPIYEKLTSYQILHLEDDNFPVLPKLMMHYVCYKTSLLRNIEYRQTEGISYTDQEWIFYPFFFVRTLLYIPVDLYQYNYGREGQTMNPQAMLRNVSHNKMITERAFTYYLDYDKDSLPSTNQSELKRQMRYQFEYLYNMYLKQQGNTFDKASIKGIDNLLKKDDSLYQELGKTVFHKCLPLPYIRIWRKTGCRINLDLVKTFYHKIK